MGIALAVIFVAVVFITTSIIFFLIFKTHCSSGILLYDSNNKEISDCNYQPEVVWKQDHLEDSTGSHIFDSDDNNRDSFIETVAFKEDLDSESTNKNSTSTNV